eukprot:2841000-Heterocapsa_arctica.AAC.1
MSVAIWVQAAMWIASLFGTTNMVGKRKAIEIPLEPAMVCLNALPIGFIKPGQSFYPDKDFKKAPSWSKAQRLLPCLNQLMGVTQGHGILHLSMRAAVSKWSAEQELGYDELTIED